MGFFSKVPSPYYCPECKSKDIVEYDETFECTKCNLEFFKDGFGEFDDGNELSVQELDGIFSSFDELKDEDTRKRFLKSLREDKLED